MMRINELKRIWADGGTAFGAWCSTGSPVVAEALAQAGYDYVVFDMQHGLMGYDAYLSCLMAVSGTDVTPLARVSSNNSGEIGRAIDSGAFGVIIPMVNSVEDAELAVANTRLFPEGNRSFGPIRIGNFLSRDPATINREIACIVMIETADGVEQAARILDVPGIDAVYIGPADLALTLGIEPGVTIQPGRHSDAIESIKVACQARKVAAGIHCGNGAEAASLATSGFQMISVASDLAWLRSGARVDTDPVAKWRKSRE
jgi:4-hydroxy-2-oxoheptanedioate aldolase